MVTERRGVQAMKTLGGIVDARRKRTSAGALLELSMCEMEKHRIIKEVERVERRRMEMLARVAEIEAKQAMLQQFVKGSYGELITNQLLSSATPFPIHVTPVSGMKRRQLSY